MKLLHLSKIVEFFILPIAILLIISLLVKCSSASQILVAETKTSGSALLITPVPNTPTKTPLPSPTSTSSPSFIATNTLISSTPTPTPTTFPTQLLTALPKGVTPQESASWFFQAGCGQIFHMIPYQLPNGYQSLAVIEEKEGIYKLVWDWRQDDSTPKQWKKILSWQGNYIPLKEITFLALEENGQWWIGEVNNFCQKPALFSLIPVSGIENIFYASGRFDFDTKMTSEYWVIDQGVLWLYRRDNDRMVKQWALHELRGKGFMPYELELTGDDEPEWLLGWWQKVEGDNWQEAIDWIQLLQPDKEGYRLIGEVHRGWQRIDIDNDNVGEFLRWRPDQPGEWDIYKWNGDHFDWNGNLVRPVAVESQNLDLQNLPPIPIDIYYSIGGVVWQWPHEGGAMQQANRWPETQFGNNQSVVIGNEIIPQINARPEAQPSSEKCTPPQVDREVVSWSPDCRFALINYSPYDEGYMSAILNPANGTMVEIPNSFVYVREGRYSTFAWDPSSRFIIHAITRGGGLYQINLPSGTVKTLVSLGSDNLRNWHMGFGALMPFILRDGSILFAIQGVEQADLFPPPGVYRLFPDGQLKLLVNTHNQNDRYNNLNLSPDETMFIYDAPGDNRHITLLGLTDGKAVWDLSVTLEFVKEFRWGN